MKVKRTVFLTHIPETEQWLSNMAAQGQVLSKIEGNLFTFTPSAPGKLCYFLISPEKGGQNGGWVYYEALENGACKVASTPPLLALQVSHGIREREADLWAYYYAHRNYFLLRRLVRNLIFSSIMGLFMAFACIMKMAVEQYDILLFCLGICCLLPTGFYIYSLLHFLRSCKDVGQHVSWKRPRRPGY